MSYVLVNKTAKNITYHSSIEETVRQLLMDGVGEYKVGKTLGNGKASNLEANEQKLFYAFLKYNR